MAFIHDLLPLLTIGLHLPCTLLCRMYDKIIGGQWSTFHCIYCSHYDMSTRISSTSTAREVVIIVKEKRKLRHMPMSEQVKPFLRFIIWQMFSSFGACFCFQNQWNDWPGTCRRCLALCIASAIKCLFSSSTLLNFCFDKMLFSPDIVPSLRWRARVTFVCFSKFHLQWISRPFPECWLVFDSDAGSAICLLSIQRLITISKCRLWLAYT